MVIKVKYKDKHGKKLLKTKKGDMIDLCCAEDTFCPLGAVTYIPLGVCIELPEGYGAKVYPRSSTHKHFGIKMACSVGIIDNSYKGPNDMWLFPAECVTGKDFRNGTRGSLIEAGDRIAQFEIYKVNDNIQFEEVIELEGDDRGGIGSTGRR